MFHNFVFRNSFKPFWIVAEPIGGLDLVTLLALNVILNIINSCDQDERHSRYFWITSFVIRYSGWLRDIISRIAFVVSVKKVQESEYEVRKCRYQKVTKKEGGRGRKSGVERANRRRDWPIARFTQFCCRKRPLVLLTKWRIRKSFSRENCHWHFPPFDSQEFKNLVDKNSFSGLPTIFDF